jgi:hypothetical protein
MENLSHMPRIDALISEVTDAVEQYKTTKYDRSSGSLARHIGVEAVLYDQFTRRLLALLHASSINDASLVQKLWDRLGHITANIVGAKLRQLMELLETLSADLANTSHSVVSNVNAYHFHIECPQSHSPNIRVGGPGLP